MLVDPGNYAAGSAVTGAIRQASQATGTSFSYLLATAQVESGLNPQAGASTSSARGLFQFIDRTWLATMKEAGPALGYGRYADAITKTASGSYEVRDPALHSEILKLRTDPTANAVMAGAFTKANASILTDKLGRPPSEGELYMAHFLGAGGAARLITLAASDPNAKAADYFGTAAHANEPIFYDRSTGSARSLAQVRNILTARYDIARSNQSSPTVVAQAASEPAPTSAAAPLPSAPDTAGITDAFAAANAPKPNPVLASTAKRDAAVAEVAAAIPKPVAEDHQVFHGLFQDSNHGVPVAALVSEMWAAPKPARGADGASAPQSIPSGLLALSGIPRSRAEAVTFAKIHGKRFVKAATLRIDSEKLFGLREANAMIVRHFLEWMRKAPAGKRAEAATALAHAYLFSELSADDLVAAEGAMLILLDDPSPLVRRALADALAASPNTPPAIVLALAADQPQIAAPVLALSPLFIDADLVDAVATGGPPVQAAIAGRVGLPRSVAAAIAEVGAAESCLMLLENAGADIAPFSIDRIVERHGHLAAIREALLARDDIAVSTRLLLVAKLSETLAGFVVERKWLDADRAKRIAREACEKATVTLAAEAPMPQVRPLVHHLRVTGQLTAGLILRALLSGNVQLFEDALAELAEVPVRRVSDLVHGHGSVGLRALFGKAKLPPSSYPAFKEAIEAMREGGFTAEPGGAARLKRRMIERVLTRCEDEVPDELAPLLTLLRRFATEAAREQARIMCEEIAAAADEVEEHSEAA